MREPLTILIADDHPLFRKGGPARPAQHAAPGQGGWRGGQRQRGGTSC